MTTQSDWVEAKTLLTDLIVPLNFLARWEYAQARRRGAWPVRAVTSDGERWRIALAGGPSAVDQVRSTLAADADSDWVLEPPDGTNLIALFDVEWDTAAQELVAQTDDDLVSRVGLGWHLVKVPLVFTRALQQRLQDARDTETGNAALLLPGRRPLCGFKLPMNRAMPTTLFHCANLRRRRRCSMAALQWSEALRQRIWEDIRRQAEQQASRLDDSQRTAYLQGVNEAIDQLAAELPNELTEAAFERWGDAELAAALAARTATTTVAAYDRLSGRVDAVQWACRELGAEILNLDIGG